MMMQKKGWKEIPFKRIDGRNYGQTGGYSGNASYKSSDFIQTNGYTEWKILVKSCGGATWAKRAQFFNGDSFMSYKDLTQDGTEEYDGVTLRVFPVPVPQGCTQFRFHFYQGTDPILVFAK